MCGKLNIFLVFKKEYGLVNKKRLSIKVNLCNLQEHNSYSGIYKIERMDRVD